MIDRQMWSEIVDGLRGISRVDVQRNSWLEGGPQVLPCPVELICQLFDDSGLGDALDVGVAISPEVDRILREMSDQVLALELDQSPADLLSDPRWLNFCQKAREVLMAIEAM